ncbi:hypothetical protein ABVT39_012235 [Epinephelus coioides]
MPELPAKIIHDGTWRNHSQCMPGAIMDEIKEKMLRACKKCKRVLAFDSCKIGTSSLRKHAETCGSTPSAAAIDRYFAKRNDVAVAPPSREDKDTITNLAYCKPHSEKDVSALIESAKSLVTYFKQTNLQSHLKVTLKASVDTRWNWIHTMLEFIHSQYEHIHTLVEERGEEHRLTNLSTESLGDMVTFLARFKEATKALEASKSPTLHLTVVWLEQLKSHLQPATTDSMILSSLKKKSLRILNNKLKVHLLHKMSVFLHPKLKSLNLLPDQGDVVTVHGEAHRLVQGKNSLLAYNRNIVS